MPTSNEETLGVYERNADKYVTGTPEKVSDEFKAWIDTALGMLPPGSTIFEIGSAFGRDAVYFESQGYNVQRTDAAKAFVELLGSHGHDARQFNALTDEWPSGFDMIFANAVFLHFDEQEFGLAVRKAFEALEAGGIFVLSVKEGKGEGWSSQKMGEPRYFKYWLPGPLQAALEAVGFQVVTLDEADDKKWLHAIVKK